MDVFWFVLIIVFSSLLLGGFIEWLKFKTKQRELGASTEETDEALRALRAEFEEQQKRLVRRIEHLEAIVTSQDWDLLETGAEERLKLDAPHEDLTAAERLARRTRS